MQKPFMKITALVLLLSLLMGMTACGAEETATVTPKAEIMEAEPSPAVMTPEDDTSGMGELRISELSAKNHATLRSEDGGFYDWAEIENISEHAWNLSGWRLSDGRSKDGWEFPDVTIPAGGRIVVYCAGKGGGKAGLYADFALSEGETLYLKNPGGTVIASAECSNSRADAVLCIQEDGTYAESVYPTPGYPNTPEGYDAWQATLAVPDGLIISEVMVENFLFLPRRDGSCHDWVELENRSDAPLELSDYYLSDDEDDYTLFRLPQRTLKPGERVTVFCTGGEYTDTEGIYAPFKLDSSSEQLFLWDGEGVHDFARLRDIPYHGTYGRVKGEQGWFYFAAPTPGGENGRGYRRVSEMPVTLTPDGVVDGSSVTVALSGEGEIHYTLDSSVPTAGSPVYTEPIKLKKTTVLRAVAIQDGALPSRPLTLTYLINENLSLPAVSVVTDDLSRYNFIYYNNEKGIEVPGYVSFYEEGGGFSLGCGIKMNGSTSLDLFKKNLALRFRGCYGQEKLEYDLYGGGVTEFTNFVLRAGQDYYSAIIRTELMQELALQSSHSLVTQRSRYCILYVNGKYSGIFALKEKTNEQLYASLLGTDKKNVQMEEAHLPVTSDFYKDVWLFCTGHDMSLAENYAHFCELVDVDSLIDWIIMEGYCCNDDLTSGNVRYVRSNVGDGKWRLVFYDLDSSLNNPEKNYYNLLSDLAVSVQQISKLIRVLFNNAEFTDRFLTRAGELLNTTLTNENVAATIDALANQIEPEVERDYVRADMTLRKWKNNIAYLHRFIEDNDWRQHNIDTLCKIFRLTEAQREQYFGKK